MADYMPMMKYVTKCGRPTSNQTRVFGKLNQTLSIVVSMVHKNICLEELPKHMKNLDMQKLK